MYIIDDTYFKSLNREIPNLDEADSRSFAELERIIDDKCRLLLLDFLSVEEFQELDGYLVNGIFPENAQPDPLLPDYVPQKWISLVNGSTYQINNVDFIWNGLAYSKGTYKGSLLADYVYSFWLKGMASYMTGVGDAKANPKGASLVNPTQRYVNIWNAFVLAYEGYRCYEWFVDYDMWVINPGGIYKNQSNEVSLLGYINSQSEDFPYRHIVRHEVKNQLGL